MLHRPFLRAEALASTPHTVLLVLHHYCRHRPSDTTNTATSAYEEKAALHASCASSWVHDLLAIHRAARSAVVENTAAVFTDGSSNGASTSSSPQSLSSGWWNANSSWCLPSLAAHLLVDAAISQCYTDASSSPSAVDEAPYARAAVLGASGAATASAAGLSTAALVAAREAFVGHLLDAPVAQMSAFSRQSSSSSSISSSGRGRSSSGGRGSASATLVLLVTWMSAGLKDASAVEIATFFGLNASSSEEEEEEGQGKEERTVMKGGAPAARAVAFFAVIENLQSGRIAGSKGKGGSSSSSSSSSSASGSSSSSASGSSSGFSDGNDDDESAITLGKAAASAYLRLLVADDAAKLIPSPTTITTNTSRSYTSSIVASETNDAAHTMIPLPGLVAAQKRVQPSLACSHWWCGVQQLVANHTDSASIKPSNVTVGAMKATGKYAPGCTRVVARRLLGQMAAGRISEAREGEDKLSKLLGSTWVQLKAADVDFVSDF